MKSEKPQFKLTRVAGKEAADSPEIVSVNDTPANGGLDRRGFLGAGVSVAAAALFVATGAEQAAALPFLNSFNASPKTAGEGIMSLGVTPDGKHLVSVSDFDTITLWSLPEGKLLHSRRVDKSMNNAHAAGSKAHGPTDSSGANHFMMLALGTEGLPSGLRSKIGGREIRAVAVTPDGQNLACASGKDIYIWSLGNDRPVAERKIEAGDVELLAMTSNARTLAAVSSNGTLTVWNNGSTESIEANELMEMVTDNTAKSTGQISQTELQALALSPDGAMLSAGFSNGMILFLNLNQTRRRRRRRRRGSSSSGGYRVRTPGRGGSTRTVPCGVQPGPGEVCTCNCM